MKKKSKYKTGLDNCERVKKILIREGHKVDGPFSKVLFQGGRKNKVHVDVFGVYDLISYKEGITHYHQVTSLNIKSRKVKKIRTSGILPGIVWCDAPIKGKSRFRRFVVREELLNINDSWEINPVFD